MKKPKGWHKNWFPIHYSDTGYAILEPDYRKNWSQRGRRAYKKFLSSGVTLRAVDRETFTDAYKKADFLPSMKMSFAKFYEKFSAINPESVRQWLVYDATGKPISGLAVHDFQGIHSVHLVAFSTPDSHDSQAGTGLIDAWFADSLAKNMKYIHFDQIRQKHGPRDQKGYSEFKNNFIQYRVSYPESYVKFF